MPDIAPNASSTPTPGSLNDLLDEVEALNRGHEQPTLRTVMETFGRAGALPVMMVVALVVVSPLSGIPLLSSAAGLTIAGIALQLALGRQSLWLPGWLCHRSVPSDRLDAAIERLRPLARFLDHHTRPRLRSLTQAPVANLLLLLCGVAGLTMPMLEILPFTSSFMAMAVTLIGFSLLTRDGIWAILAVLPMVAATGLLATVTASAAPL